MATRAQIDRLAQRIDQLVGRLVPTGPRVFARIIFDPRRDATEEAAIERHFADNPADRNATDLIIRKIVYPTHWKGQSHGHPVTD
jgi:hypothetical protein